MAERKVRSIDVITASDMPEERKRVVVREVAITSLVPNPRQPRSNYEAEPLDELAASIKAKGILQPLVVKELATGGYEIVFGHRRWLAADKAGLTTVPAIVRIVVDGKDSLILALTENKVRHDMSELDEGRGYVNLQEEFGMTQAEIAAEIGVDQSQISRAIKLAKAPEPVQEWLETETISPSAAGTILAAASKASKPDKVLRKAAAAIQDGNVTAASLKAKLTPQSKEKGHLAMAVATVNKALLNGKAKIESGKVVEL